MTKHSKQTKEEAFALFVNDKSLAEIGRLLDVSRQTLSKWKAEGNWAERTKGVDAKVAAKIDENLTEIRIRQRNIAKATQADYIKHLQANPKKTQYRDADAAMKHELLLAGQETERVGVTGELTVTETLRKILKKKEDEK
jgi:hypothetical protein